MTLVFNELSATTVAYTRADAMNRMSAMVESIAALAGKRALKLMAVGPIGFFGIVLAENYSLGDWLQDLAVDRDQRQFLRIISTKVAFDQEVSEAVNERFLLSDFHVVERNARGLGLAYLLGTVAVSLRSDEYWMNVRVTLQHSWLEADESLHFKDVVALNIADRAQANSVAAEMLTQARDELRSSPRDLVARFRECFPHLDFGLDVETQLSLLPWDVLDPTIAKLTVLDGAIRDWRVAATELPSLPKVHAESEPTMQQYGHKRRFRTSGGDVAIYGPHAMVGKRYRIHFRVNRLLRSLDVGYIGVHLPTASVPK